MTEYNLSSYSPTYFQPIIWVCKYKDGSLLREWDEDGHVTPFSKIDKFQLAEFHMISKDFDYFFDCKTGIFVIDGREFIFPLSGMELDFAEGLIQFKEASTEFVADVLKCSDYDGFEIESFNFGWKVTHQNLKVQVILSLPTKVFTVEMTMLDLQKTITWKVKV